MILFENAEKQLEFLKELEQQIQNQLKDAPVEILRLSKSNGQFQYYAETEKKRTYIRKKNILFAKKLAQRDYNKKLIPCIRKNIHMLEQFLKGYSPQGCIKCYSNLPVSRKLLVEPFFMDNQNYSKRWQAQKHEPKKEFPIENYLTTKEEKVRSKSEVIIANTLNSKGIPYHYEALLKINANLTFHPDFLCLNKRTRQEFYWEHCGMMETREQPLNTKDVERVIGAFLV